MKLKLHQPDAYYFAYGRRHREDRSKDRLRSTHAEVIAYNEGWLDSGDDARALGLP